MAPRTAENEYYFKHVQFHFSDRTTYNQWKKTKVETLSAD
jgi:hypothetical protein